MIIHNYVCSSQKVSWIITRVSYWAQSTWASHWLYKTKSALDLPWPLLCRHHLLNYTSGINRSAKRKGKFLLVFTSFKTRTLHLAQTHQWVTFTWKSCQNDLLGRKRGESILNPRSFRSSPDSRPEVTQILGLSSEPRPNFDLPYYTVSSKTSLVNAVTCLVCIQSYNWFMFWLKFSHK